jgi:type I restriction enzyme S subunit
LLPFPIPPQNEQKRIVFRIQNFLRLLDNLEKVEKELDALEKEFPEKLKKSLLQAAMQGKLTEQLPEDGDARHLLAEIQQERQRKIKTGEIKATKPLPPINPKEVPYEIPENWVWTQLNNTGDWKAGVTPKRSNFSYYANGTIPWLVTGDLNDGLITSTQEKISTKALIETKLTKNSIGTVLMAMYGATIGKLGVLGIEATTNQACIACSVNNGLFNWFLFYYLLFSRDKFRLMGAGGAQPNISKEKILPFLIPIPPFPEQKRIAKVLGKLFPVCEELKNL